ncbi:MAG TPA: dTDP-4-dehydrorhamnose reductase [Chthoniobacterales bacterium]|nr:dTDP-4-dehydrorhamnose reductase [Chthoniobacterales bacterium]
MTPRIAIVGAGGRLGAALLREYARGGEAVGFTRQQLDLTDSARVRDTLGGLSFDVLINCVAQTNVDRCETHPDEAFQLNAEAPRALAEICTRKGARLVHISTDYVFDGEKPAPYAEEDAAKPISVYGESKRAGEERVLEVSDRHLVARVSWVFGPDRPSFIDWAMQQAREHEHVEAISDKLSTPSYTLDLADMLGRLMSHDDAAGIYHVTNSGMCAWQEYAQHAIDCCIAEGIAVRARNVAPVPLASMARFIARRPLYTILSTARYTALSGHTPRHWQDAVADYVRSYIVAHRQA